MLTYFFILTLTCISSIANAADENPSQEININKSYQELRQKACDRNLPCQVVGYLTENSPIDFFDAVGFLDAVELVNRFGQYTIKDFRSTQQTIHVIEKSLEGFLAKHCGSNPLIAYQLKIFLTSTNKVSNLHSLDYKVSLEGSTKRVTINHSGSILGIALCHDHVPAKLFQHGLQYIIKNNEETNEFLEELEEDVATKQFWDEYFSKIPQEQQESIKQDVYTYLRSLPED